MKRDRDMELRRKNVLRFLFTLGCLTGFLVQMSLYMQHYYTWPTRIDIYQAFDSKIEMPTYTFCNNNRYRLSEVKKTIPELKNNVTIDDNIVASLLMKKQMTIDQLVHIGHQKDDMMDFLHWHPFITNLYVGRNGNCFLANGNVTGESNYTLYQRVGSEYNNIVLKLVLNGEEYLELVRNECKGLIAIHNAYELVPMEEKALSIYPGEDLVLLYTKEVIKTLAPPYKTQCLDYVGLHRRSRFQGSLSKKMCEFQCFLKYFREERIFPIYNNIMVYPFSSAELQDMTFIEDTMPNGEKIFFNLLWKNCSEQCPTDCEYVEFHYRENRRAITEISKQILEPHRSKNVSVAEARAKGFLPIYLVLQPLDFNYQVMSMQPLMQRIEVFGYFGGTLGMWLGFSLLSAPSAISYLVSAVSARYQRRLGRRPRETKLIRVSSRFRSPTF